MKTCGLLYILLFFLILPAKLYPEELYSIGIRKDLTERPISLKHYRDGKWEKEPFPPGGEFSSNAAPCLGISPDGELWMVWAARRNEELPRIYFSRRSGGNWSAGRPVSAGEGWEETPVIALDLTGIPLVAWSRTDDDRTNVFCARWEGNAFARPEMVSRPENSPNVNPALGFGEDNSPVLIWEGWDGTRYRIFFSNRAGCGWGVGKQLFPGTGGDQVFPSIVHISGGIKARWLQNGSRMQSDREAGRWFTPYPDHSKNTVPRAPVTDDRAWTVISGNGRGSVPCHTLLLDSTPAKHISLSFPEPYGSRAAANYVFVGYGDSITYGTTPPGGDPADHKGDCYIPLLLGMLEADYPLDTFTIYNGGFPGATTAQLLNGGGSWGCPGIISAINQTGCSQILIMGGTNDITDLTAPSTTKNNLGAMIDRARTLSCEPVLASIIPRCDKSSLNDDTTTLVSSYIRPLATEKNCRFADPWQKYLENINWCNEYLTWWDKLHPYYPDGSQPIADAWYDAIVIYTPSPTPSPTPEPVSAIIDSGDYDGDGASDIAIFRESIGLWAIRGITRVYFGSPDDIPASGDYNNDGTTDIAIFRGSSGLWAVRGITRAYFGGNSDLSAPGDYNGDGICDMAIYRGSTGLWAAREITRCYFGSGEDIPVPGYYGGNQVKEIAVFRPSTGLWACRGSTRFYFGSSDDQPVAADYDGSGSDQAGIFRFSSGLWAIRGYSRFYYGSSNDRPVPASYTGVMTEAAIFRETTGLWSLRELSRVYYGTVSDIPVTGRVPQPVTPTPTATPSVMPTPDTTPSVMPTPNTTPSVMPTP